MSVNDIGKMRKMVGFPGTRAKINFYCNIIGIAL